MDIAYTPFFNKAFLFGTIVFVVNNRYNATRFAPLDILAFVRLL